MTMGVWGSYVTSHR